MRLILTIIFIVLIGDGCSRHHVKNISTPKKKEIKKAMKYSTWN